MKISFKRLILICFLLLAIPLVSTGPANAGPQFIELSRQVLPMPPEDDEGGIKNVALSAQLIDQVILEPGEIFSYNKIVGPRTLERGFAWSEAIGWLNGELTYVPDVGGGVCRTSTALHQTVLNAGLEILERHSHSLDVDYAERGNDATVWYGVLDYRFKNTKDNPIKINAAVEDKMLIISLEEKSPISVMLNGQYVSLNAAPFIYQSSLMVPVRSVSEALGAIVSWDNTINAAIITNGHNTVNLSVNDSEGGVDNQIIIKNGTMFMAARYLGMAMGYNVEWDNETKTLNYT
ncbi:VanW family protein [Desulfofalx alkaliphila]|uniref:VanW family protein n=1 Tax=Desulfofalx alkaliphila TaxID=105483 RepID=UPI000AC2B706|nr:VanW family protein [Desulfofalx alkaliphila]